MTESPASPQRPSWRLTPSQIRLIIAVASIIVAVVLVLLDINTGNGQNNPTRGPGTTSSSPAATKSPHRYANCDEAWADGRTNIPWDDPAYDPSLDRNGNGWACQR
jgi:hypothetical protein